MHRAILSRYLKAVMIRKSARRGVAAGDLDYSAIEPVWKDGTEPDSGGTPPGTKPGWELLKALHATGTPA